MSATIYQTRQMLNSERFTSRLPLDKPWGKGVLRYANELLDKAEENQPDALLRVTDNPNDRETITTLLLEGAKNWKEYSYGAYALVANEDIVNRLGSPEEIEASNHGTNPPNSVYAANWLDLQTIALKQAADLIYSAVWRIEQQQQDHKF